MISDERAVANVLARYAELIDEADFTGLGQLFADGAVRFDGGTEVFAGAEAVAAMYRSVVQVHGDSPLTKHVMTNFWIVVDDAGTEASCRSYFTVFQAHPDMPLQVISCGRYVDRLQKADGEWHFVDRMIIRDLVGDLRFHLRRDPYEDAET